MSISVAYLHQAKEEIKTVYRYYEQQRVALGEKFLENLNEVIVRLRENPRIYGVFRGDLRAAKVSRFPYVVYYRDHGHYVLIIAVQHGRRSTRNWQRRTEN